MKASPGSLSGSGRAALFVVLVAMALTGCGGGGSSESASSSASSAPQVASGIVTGFGSIFVDGVELDDSRAATVVDSGYGAFVNTMTQLGQRVRVLHDASGSASRVTVQASVAGPVGTVDPSASSLTVAAQVVTTNTDPANGPVTVYGGGYSSFADLKVSDLVEVHGIPVYDATAKSYTVQATRIQRLQVISTIRVMGLVSNLDPSAKTFSINGLTVDYTTALLLPTDVVLAENQKVMAFAPPGALVGTTLSASRVVQANADDGATDSRVQLGGIVANYDSTAGTFDLGGTLVHIGSAKVTPANRALAEGMYVQIHGTIGSDGSIAATAIHIRAQTRTETLANIRLIGPITDSADSGHFVVRDVPVDATSATLAPNCPILADGVIVNVVATQQAGTDVVLANSVSCQGGQMTPTRSFRGTMSGVGPSDTFMLTTSSGTQTISWNDRTTFVGIAGITESLVGSSMAIEGYMSGATVVARVVRTVGSIQADQYRPGGVGWAMYQLHRK